MKKAMLQQDRDTVPVQVSPERVARWAAVCCILIAGLLLTTPAHAAGQKPDKVPLAWMQYQTALRQAPKGEDWLKTLIALSERTDSWSQEEGLGLFLLIAGYVPGWQARFLQPDFPSPFAVLREAVGKRAPLNLPVRSQ